MAPLLTGDDRRLAFEAKRLAVETLVKIRLEQVGSAHRLATSHLRLMSTLSLGALAGVATLYGALLRFSPAVVINTATIIHAAVSLSALPVLVASALLSARALRRGAAEAMPFLRDPFPNAKSEIESIFEQEGLDEDEVLKRLYIAIDKGIESQPTFDIGSSLSTSLMILGLLLAGTSFLL